ncbi:alpha/beta fold hydrolase [Deinococcus sp.]|uniref:alpha/beta fold hydrolase n=1 Tax=Deinococcus sp. TaxID=47478 RepID=UPI003C7C3ACE
MTTPFIAVSGRAQLHGEVAGSGDLLLFLHAGVGDRRMWTAQLQALSSTHQVAAYDRRGFGETPHVDEPYSQSNDLRAVLTALGTDTATLIGASQGGQIAVDFALQFPAQVRALVLAAPAIGGAPFDLAASQSAQALIEQAEEAEDLDQVNALEALLWLDGPVSSAGRVGGDVRALFLQMNGAALRAVPLGEEVEEQEGYSRLSDLKVPTLILWGDLDLPQVQSRALDVAQTIPGAQHQVITGTAHLPNLEQPDTFNAHLKQFLGSVRGSYSH